MRLQAGKHGRRFSRMAQGYTIPSHFSFFFKKIIFLTCIMFLFWPQRYSATTIEERREP
jgi:hypothetical protein